MLLDLGTRYLEQGNYSQAILHYEECIEKEPENLEYYWYLGVAYLLLENKETTNDLWMSIFLQGTSEEIDLWTQNLIHVLEYLFEIFIKTKNFFATKILFNTIKDLDKNHQLIHLNIEKNLFSDFVDFLLKRAVIYAKNQDFLTAETEFNFLILLQDSFGLNVLKDLALYNLAILYLNNGQLTKSLNAINQAINLNHVNGDYFYLLGLIFEKLGQFNNANLAYQKAKKLGLQIHEDFFISLGYCFFKNAQCDLAVNLLEEALNYYPKDLRLKRLNQALLPVIYKNTEELNFYRHRFTTLLDNLIDSINFDNYQTQEALQSLQLTTNFLLGYQGKNDLKLQLRYAKYLEKIISSLYPQYCQSLTVKKTTNRRIKVGYISQRLQSMLGILAAGWLKFHSQEDFEIYSYDLGNDENQVVIHDFEEYSDFYINLPLEIEEICKQITQDKLDILVFLDIGMDPIVMILASMRLAPVQCTTWGHPITSGLKTIDYFLSSELMEPKNAEDHYSETLIYLPNIGVAVAQPIIPPLTLTREDFKIPEHKIMYLSCQSLFKYLPQFDYIYPRIAQQVPESIFIFISLNESPVGNQLFEQRLRQIFKSYGLNSHQFCIFVPRSTHGRFIALNQLADVGLDTLSWSGGITTLHSLACNLPIVTCPGEFMRGRHAYGILRMLGVTETIAYTEEEYIQIAVELGREGKWRQTIRDAIAFYKRRIYDDLECVKFLEKFYRQVIND